MTKSTSFLLLIVLVSIFVVSSCCKGDPECPNCPTEETSCQDSTIFNFEMYGYQYDHNYGVDHYGILSCNSPQYFEVSINCSSLLKLPTGEEVTLVLTNGYWEAEISNSGDYRKYIYDPCNESFTKEEYDYSGGSYFYSKPLKTTICPSSFSPMVCNNGPIGNVCYSSLEKQYNYPFMDNAKYVIEPDTLLQEVTVKFKQNTGLATTFLLTLPLDSINTIKLGNYSIGTLPFGHQPILNCLLLEYNVPTITFADFTSGILSVSKVNNNFHFAWNINGCNESIWTGSVRDPM